MMSAVKFAAPPKYRGDFKICYYHDIDNQKEYFILTPHAAVNKTIYRYDIYENRYEMG